MQRLKEKGEEMRRQQRAATKPTSARATEGDMDALAAGFGALGGLGAAAAPAPPANSIAMEGMMGALPTVNNNAVDGDHGGRRRRRRTHRRKRVIRRKTQRRRR